MPPTAAHTTNSNWVGVDVHKRQGGSTDTERVAPHTSEWEVIDFGQERGGTAVGASAPNARHTKCLAMDNRGAVTTERCGGEPNGWAARAALACGQGTYHMIWIACVSAQDTRIPRQWLAHPGTVVRLATDEKKNMCERKPGHAPTRTVRRRCTRHRHERPAAQGTRLTSIHPSEHRHAASAAGSVRQAIVGSKRTSTRGGK